jgi:arsenate reductase
MSKIKVLFLCTGNSARSQMAEAFLRKFGGDQFEAYSAGIEPRDIHPYTKRVMEEVGISLSGHSSKHIKEYMGRINLAYVIILCEEAEKQCPTTFPGITKRLNWSFEDPSAVDESDDKKLKKFREVRDKIEQRIKSWVSEKQSR